MDPSLNGFTTYINQTFTWSTWARGASDERGTHTQVPTHLILSSTILQVLKGLSSCLKVDQHLRLPSMARALGVDYPDPGDCVFSDSTLLRCMQGLDRDWLSGLSTHCARSLAEEGHLTYTLSSGRSIRPLMVDGTCFGDHRASVAAYAGDDGTYPVSLEPFNKQGKERGATRRLRDGWCDRSDTPDPSHVLLDGLYRSRSDLSNWKSIGTHPVIKTSESNTRLINRAESLFHQPGTLRDHHSTDIARSHDEDQHQTYRLWTVGPLCWDGSTPYLTVGRLEVIHDTADRDVYWLVTTDHDLSAQDLMELAGLRWRIENNVFKRLNERVGSKNAYLKNADAKYSLLQLWMLGWCMVQTFWLACEPVLREWSQTVKTTTYWFQCLVYERELNRYRPPPD